MIMENPKIESLLPFFNFLNDEEKKLIETRGKYIKFAKGSSLLNNTDECLGLITVLYGQLRAYTVSEEGKEITLYRLIEGDTCIMSASCMLKDISFTISLTFEKDSQVFVIPTDIYDKLNQSYTQINDYTQKLINGRFSDVMWVFEQYVFTKMAFRLASSLIEQASLNNDNVVFVTHEELARDIGSAREVVTRMLKQFEEEKLIKLSRGKIEIIDLSRLRRV